MPALAQSSPPVEVKAVGPVCSTRAECRRTDAIFFIHGIYGSAETFQNGSYAWPIALKRQLSDRRVDIYTVQYKTPLLTWLKADVASFDEIAIEMFQAVYGRVSPGNVEIRDGLLARLSYRSIGVIAHSLGGNFAAALMQTVKAELGHDAHAQQAFLVTLGTPANGAALATVADIAKKLMLIEDPLLGSLRRDNTFLRMLARWRESTSRKAVRFGCRVVNLHVAIEGKSTFGFEVVPAASASEPYQDIAQSIRTFEAHDHFDIAAPTADDDPLNRWVIDIVRTEFRRIDNWREPRRCRRPTL